MSIEKTLDIVRNTNDDNKLRRMLTNAKKSFNKDANLVVNAIEAKLKAKAPQTKEFVPPSNPYAVELQAIAEEMQKKYVLKFNTLEHNNVKTGGARLNGNRKLDFYLRYKMDHDHAVGLCIVQEHNENVPTFEFISVREQKILRYSNANIAKMHWLMQLNVMNKNCKKS
ncbi:hypothetical protein JCM19052_4705 [Vibrio sp. JCM 19052]|nr:hypothetical protein JCM19052_4705 [Vibrio sp. JCM 19052]